MAPEIDSGFSAAMRVYELEKRVGELEDRLRTITQAVMYLARLGDGRFVASELRKIIEP